MVICRMLHVCISGNLSDFYRHCKLGVLQYILSPKDRMVYNFTPRKTQVFQCCVQLTKVHLKIVFLFPVYEL